MKIYPASSWRNAGYSFVLNELRDAGHEVWDWRNPPNGDPGFQWEQADPLWQPGQHIGTDAYKRMLEHHRSQQGYRNDLEGMMWADACVLILPCGRSAHLEAGYMCGRGKPVHALRMAHDEPDLMYLLFDAIHGTIPELKAALTESVMPPADVEQYAYKDSCYSHTPPLPLAQDGTCPECDADK